MKLTALQELIKSDPIVESSHDGDGDGEEFKDSADFTEDFFGMVDELKTMKVELTKTKWRKWMEDTDSSFATSTASLFNESVQKMNDLVDVMELLANELESAA